MCKDKDGTVTIGAVLLNAALNVVISGIGSYLVGEEFGWKEAGVAALIGAIGSIEKYGVVFGALMSGIYTGYTSSKSGASLAASIGSGIAATITSVMTLETLTNVKAYAGIGKIEKKISDVIISSGINYAGTAVSSAITNNSIRRHGQVKKWTRSGRVEISMKQIYQRKQSAHYKKLLSLQDTY